MLTWTLKTFQGSWGLQDKVQASGSRKGPRQLAGGLCSRGQVPCSLWVLKQEDIPEPQESQAWIGAGPLSGWGGSPAPSHTAHLPFPTLQICCSLKTPHWNLSFVHPSSSARQNPAHLSRPTKSHPLFETPPRQRPPPILRQNRLPPRGTHGPLVSVWPSAHCLRVDLLTPCCPSRGRGLAALASSTHAPHALECEPAPLPQQPWPLQTTAPSPKAAAIRPRHTTPSPLRANPLLWGPVPPQHLPACSWRTVLSPGCLNSVGFSS